MLFKEYTDKKAIQLLATQSRRADITPYMLSQAHIKLGRYLAYQICEEVELCDCEIQHPQGKKIGKKIQDEGDILLFSLMRAGMYLSEALREIFQECNLFHVYPIKNIGLEDRELRSLPILKDKIVILVDSVINTGGTMIPMIKQFDKLKPKKIIVTTLVMPDTTAEMFKKDFDDYKNLSMYVARVSKNKYIGKGKTDTGNRLFGTL